MLRIEAEENEKENLNISSSDSNSDSQKNRTSSSEYNAKSRKKPDNVSSDEEDDKDDFDCDIEQQNAPLVIAVDENVNTNQQKPGHPHSKTKDRTVSEDNIVHYQLNVAESGYFDDDHAHAMVVGTRLNPGMKNANTTNLKSPYYKTNNNTSKSASNSTSTAINNRNARKNRNAQTWCNANQIGPPSSNSIFGNISLKRIASHGSHLSILPGALYNPSNMRRKISSGVYTHNSDNCNRQSKASVISAADLETQVEKWSIACDRGRGLRDSFVSTRSGKLLKDQKYQKTLIHINRNEITNDSGYLTVETDSSSSDDDEHSSMLDSSFIPFEREKSLKHKRTMFAVVGLGFIMFLGKSQAMAFNYLKTFGLYSIGRANRGQFIDLDFAKNEGNFFDSSENNSHIEVEDLPKLRFINRRLNGDISSAGGWEEILPFCENRNSSKNNEDISLQAIRQAADEFGPFILLDGIGARKNKPSTSWWSSERESDKADRAKPQLHFRVPIFTQHGEETVNGSRIVKAGIAYTSVACYIKGIDIVDDESVSLEKPFFFVTEEDVDALEKNIQSVKAASSIATNSDDSELDVSGSDEITVPNVPAEEMSAKLSTIFLFVAGFGRLLGGVFSDLTVRYGIPKSAYFIVALLMMAVPFRILAKNGWTDAKNSNDFDISQNDSTSLTWITLVFAMGYGIACSISPIYLKGILPPHVMGRVYGMQVLLCASGNMVFNSIFKLGDSLIDEELYPNVCVGPDCAKTFFETGFYCILFTLFVAVAMVANDCLGMRKERCGHQ